MGIEIDVTANAKGFVQATGQAAASLNDIADTLEFIGQNANFSDDQLQALFERTIQQAKEAGAAAQQGYNGGTVAVRDFGAALTQTNRELAQTQEQLDRVTATPAVLDESLNRASNSATETTTALRTTGQAATESGEKIQDSSKLTEGAMFNLGYSAMSASTLFTSGFQGMLEQAGTFAAFMGPSMAGVEGAIGALAWPLTIAGVGLAAIGGLMAGDATEAANLKSAVQDFINTFEGTAKGTDVLDKGLRAWAKDAQDFGGVALTDLASAARTSGVAFDQVASSIIGKSVPAMKQQLDAATDLQTSYIAQANAVDLSTKNGYSERASLLAKANAVDTVKSALQQQISAQNQANQAERLLASSMGLSLSQYKSYEGIIQTAATNNVKLTSAQKTQIQAALESGQSAGSLKKQITDYANALKTSQTEQDNWNKNVQSSFSNAAGDASDWAKDTKVDLGQVATNLGEANKEFQELPGNLAKAMKGGLSQAGAAFLESLPNGEQIINQLGLDPGSSTAKKLIAQANQAGANAGKSVSDGLAKVPPLDVKVTAAADTAEARKRLDALKADLKPKVDPIPDVSAAKKKLDDLTKKRTASVVPKVDTTQAEKDLNYLLRDRTVTVTVKTRNGARVP